MYDMGNVGYPIRCVQIRNSDLLCGGPWSSLKIAATSQEYISQGDRGVPLTKGVANILKSVTSGLIQNAGLTLGPPRQVFTAGELEDFLSVMVEIGLRHRRGRASDSGPGMEGGKREVNE